jgi:cell division protein ZapE
MDEFYDSLPPDFPKRRVHYHEFMIGVHDEMHRARQKGDADKALLKYAEKLVKEARVLCFDEFHVTDIADAMILGRLFTALLDEGIVCIMTSNWPPEKLYEGGLQRDRFLPFIALLKERMDILHLDAGVDYRLLHLADSGVYFWPLGIGAAHKADETFTHLTGGMPPHAEKIAVKGREIEVAVTAKGVARFTFSQLCERPMGAEDYLVISGAYHTVFLEGVPRLGYDRRNEAKRLMTLVDAFYDRGTKLVITADVPPDQLYRGHDHEFEFQRTVSRLVEMQSPAYLGLKQ